MSTQHYILSKNDIQTIEKIYNSYFSIHKIIDLEDVSEIISIFNLCMVGEGQEYGACDCRQSIDCNYCLIAGSNDDILIYGHGDEKYWLSQIIGLPETYSVEWMINAIKAILKKISIHTPLELRLEEHSLVAKFLLYILYEDRNSIFFFDGEKVDYDEYEFRELEIKERFLVLAENKKFNQMLLSINPETRQYFNDAIKKRESDNDNMTYPF